MKTTDMLVNTIHWCEMTLKRKKMNDFFSKNFEIHIRPFERPYRVYDLREEIN